MNREEYINELKKALAEKEIDNIDEIIDKYQKRFEIGYKAGMTDEEIIDSLGSVDDIVNSYTRVDEPKYTYDLEISDVLISDLYIESIDEDGFNINISEELNDKLDIKTDNNRIQIRNKFNRSIFKKTKGTLTLQIGKNITFNQVSLNFTSTDCHIDKINCKAIAINIVSGDIEADLINADIIKISSVSGDANIIRMSANDVSVSTVSGDFDIKNINAVDAKISTISGDINLTGRIDNKSFSSISGDITMNEYNK